MLQGYYTVIILPNMEWGRGAVWFRLGAPMATVAMGAWLIPEFLSCVLDVGCP